VEIERGAYRYTYPAPGKITSSIHDYFVEREGPPMITIGYGPDFAIIRSDGVDLNIPQMIEEIKVEIPEAGVSGGGHLVVGSMKFIPGECARVREVLEIKIAETPKKIK
jgi:RecJ-like exonuclease